MCSAHSEPLCHLSLNVIDFISPLIKWWEETNLWKDIDLFDL